MKTTLLTTLFFISIFSSKAQSIISGTVSDPYESLSNASILNTTNGEGTISSPNGTFVLEAKKGDVLEVSYTGYKKMQVTVTDTNPINITFEREALGEVLIVAQAAKREYRAFCCCYSIACKLEDEKKSQEEERTVKVNEVKNVVLHPNPSDGVFYLTFYKDYEVIEINIFDMVGRLIATNKTNTRSLIFDSIGIDLYNQPMGVYIVTITADGKKLPSQKLIKN